MTLENDRIRIETDARTGGFVSLFDRRCGHEYVGAEDRVLLFRLMVPEGARWCEHLDACDVHTRRDGDRLVVSCRFVGAEAVATLELEEESLVTRLRVTNTGERPIEEIMFPLVRGLAPILDAEFIWPHFHFRRLRDLFGAALGGNHHSWNEHGQKHVGRYPQWLASAWCDYGSAEHGIAIEGRQTDFSVMDISLHKVVEKTLDPVRRTLDLDVVHPHRVNPGETYETPPVRIVLHEGDWRRVAESHRQWLETWITKPDRPERFAESIGWHFYFMKHQDGHVVNTYADLPKMAQAALAAGCPYLLVFGWQTGGHDNNYLYRYVPNEDWGGREALREAVRACREMGVEIMPFYNGTLANTGLPEHKEFGHRWEARSRDGHPYYAGDWARHNFDAPTRNREMLHHEICPCEDYRSHFLDTARRIVEDYGFGNTQLDQIAEKVFLCYNEAHGHSAPDRAYVDGLAALLPEVRRIVREVNSEGVMLEEGINEFIGQWCDSSWNWRALLDFPEPLLLTIPWVWGSVEIDALEYGDVNRAFAYKLHLDMKIDGGDSPITKYPAFADFVRERAELRRRVADCYVHADFRDRRGIESLDADGALVTVFENSADRKTGIVVAEVAGAAREVAFDCPLFPSDARVVLDSTTGQGCDLPSLRRVRLRLAPYEVCVLCVDDIR